MYDIYKNEPINLWVIKFVNFKQTFVNFKQLLKKCLLQNSAKSCIYELLVLNVFQKYNKSYTLTSEMK